MKKTYRIQHAILITSNRIFREGEDVTGEELKDSGADTKALLESGAIVGTDDMPEDPAEVAERESTEAASKAQFAVEYLSKLHGVVSRISESLKLPQTPDAIEMLEKFDEGLKTAESQYQLMSDDLMRKTEEIDGLRKERDDLKAQVAELSKPKQEAPALPVPPVAAKK